MNTLSGTYWARSLSDEYLVPSIGEMNDLSLKTSALRSASLDGHPKDFYLETLRSILLAKRIALVF